MSFHTRRSGAPRALCALLVLTFVLLTSSMQTALAQRNSSDIPIVSTVVAIEGARIVQAPGRVIEKGNVIFRDGVIVAVGRRARVPYDARVIDGDSLTVYAGFIDALSNVGVPEPKSASRDTGQSTGQGPGQNAQPTPSRSNPSFVRAGITPDKDVRTLLDPDDKSVNSYRARGFTAALAVPRGRMMPGTGSIVLLTGDKASDMIVAGMQPQMFKFQGAQGVYPGTPMAIMSKFRQLYKEASRRMQLEAMYEEDPTSMARPPFDAVHSSFFPLIRGETTVFTFTDDPLEIYRALTLREELGFEMVLAGLNGGFDPIDAVIESGVPVALTLSIPDRPDWAAEIEKDSLDQILASYDEESRTATFRDVEAERRNLEAKQMISRINYTGMPAKYADAGALFAFTSFGLDTKYIRRNLMEFIGEGLSEDDALAALTTNAAHLLGVSRIMGSVDEGKMANLVVTKGDIFEKDTKIKMVFVDGQKYEFDDCKSGCKDTFGWSK